MPSDTTAPLAPVPGPTASTGSTTTIIAPTTTLPATTTTTLVADATTADPHVLAQQLQSVLDRYIDLYMLSRSDPNRPFTDQALVDSLRQVATVDFIGTFLVPKWTEYRDEGTVSKRGATSARRMVAESVDIVSSTDVQSDICGFDNGVTYRAADGAVVDDGVFAERLTGKFVLEDGTWKIDQLDRRDVHSIPATSTSPCDEGLGS
jgi:hypothetical protein